MRAILVLLAGLAVGCRSYVEIFDGVAERGEGDRVVIRFRANRDVTRSAQFYGANLAVPSQIDPDKRWADEALEWGQALAGADQLMRVSEQTDEPGSIHVFRASFPLRGSGQADHPFPYDLSRPGTHELEFWAGGGNCGGPGGFYTNRLRLTYRVP